MIRNTFIFLILLTTNFMSAQQADDIIGMYRLPNNLEIEIFKSNNIYNGKITNVNHSTDIALQEKDIIGQVIIHDLRYDSKAKNWNHGTMYSPKKGLTFNLKINEIREKEIEVVGSKLFFWHTMTWERIL